MSRRSRIIGFGSAALLVVVGAVCTVALPGLAQDLALGVMGVGLVVAVSLVFLEVGFSEDRARAREETAREDTAREGARGEAPRRREQAQAGRSPVQRTRPRLERSRGRTRRLR